MRLLAVAVCLVALTVGYILLLWRFNVSELPGERHFGVIDGSEPPGEVYLEPISIDALNDAMQIRAYLSPSVTESKDAHGAPSRDLRLLVTHDRTVEEIKVAAADHIASSIFEIDLSDGTVAHYPLDSYRAQFGVQLLDGKSSLPLPVRVTMWEGLLGYNLRTTNHPQAEPKDVELTTTIARSGAFALFALCAYAAMIVLGSCALAVGILTFTEVRRPEATLIGALRQSPSPCPSCATRCRARRRSGSKRICGCSCGPNWLRCSRLRSWFSNGRKPVLPLRVLGDWTERQMPL
jgi:Domain of unknown function (DUF4436)